MNKTHSGSLIVGNTNSCLSVYANPDMFTTEVFGAPYTLTGYGENEDGCIVVTLTPGRPLQGGKSVNWVFDSSGRRRLQLRRPAQLERLAKFKFGATQVADWTEG